MSDNTVMQVPDYIADRIRARQEGGKKSAITSSIVGDGDSYPRISTRSSRYRLVESGVETMIGDTLDVVIVGANPKVSKVYYDKPYSGDKMAPTCASDDGIRPNASIEDPVCDNCAACPNNVLGSKILPSGAKSKKCADQRHLAVVAAADPSKVYGLTVPVSGMKGLREYLKDLANYGVSPEEAVTELGFDPNASYPRMTFKHKGYVPKAVIGAVEELTQHDTVLVATRQKPYTGGSAALPSGSQPKQLASEAVDDAYEEEVEQEKPKAKKTKPKVEPVKASDDLANNIAALFDN